MRENIRFSDNSPITPEDVVYSLREAVMTGKPIPIKFAKEVASKKRPKEQLAVRALQHAVQIELEHPDNYFLRNFGRPIVVPVVKKTYMEKISKEPF